MKHPLSLIISTGILCILGLRSLIGLPEMLAVQQHGSLTGAAHAGSVVGAVTGVALCFILAFGLWRTRGRWGLGIAIYALLVVAVQCFLMYLAVGSGRIELDAMAIIRFFVFTIVGGVGLAISAYLSHKNSKKKNA